MPTETTGPLVRFFGVFARVVPLLIAIILAIVVWQSGETDVSKHLVGWPFLLFVVFALMIALLGKDLAKAIKTRQFEFGKDGIKIGDHLKELEVEASEDFKSLTDRLAELEARFANPKPKAVRGETATDKEKHCYKMMLAGISGSRFTWRSIERLAIIAGIEEGEAARILAEYGVGEVVMSKGKSGRAIARLIS